MAVYGFMVYIAVCIVSIFSIFQWLKSTKKYRWLSKLKGPKGTPVLGNFAELAVNPEKAFESWYQLRKDYGTLYCLWLLNTPLVVASKAEDLEKILSSSKEINKASVYNFLHSWLGTGLLTSSGSKWQSHRKMITPTFHFAMLESFVDIFVDNSNIMLEKLKKIPSGSEFDIFPMIMTLTLDIICKTAMGVDVKAQDETDKEGKLYSNSLTTMCKAVNEQMFKPWFWNKWLFYLFSDAGYRRHYAIKVLQQYTLKVIGQRKAARGQSIEEEYQDDGIGIKKKKAFLDVLLDASENGSKLTDIEIKEEVDTFLFEGNDTTTNSLGWTLLLIGNHPDVQEKLAEELAAIFGGSNRRITSADLSEMKYMERVLKESLRLYPSVPAVGRSLIDDVQIGDYMIPAGTDVRLDFMVTHLDPAYYKNPHEFNPDNFLPENTRSRHSYAYLAFSAGPRNCIGQKFALSEEKVVLATILRNFRVEAVDKVNEVTRITEITLKPKQGIRLKLYPR